MSTSAAINALAASPGPSSVAYAVAALRREQMLAEADYHRLLLQARPARPPVAARQLRVARALTVVIRRLTRTGEAVIGEATH